LGWNLEADVLLWSDNMFRLLGLEPDEITPTSDYVVGLIASVQDVTELAEAMRKSEESLTLIETLQSTAPAGFAFVSPTTLRELLG
jgi:hypothetical protein